MAIVCNISTLQRQLRDLSRAYGHLWIGDDFEFVIVDGVKLPPGYNRSHTAILLKPPSDYPCSPPGIGSSQVFVSPCLRFRGRQLQDVHEDRAPAFETPGFGPWAWWCYEYVKWDPFRDNLITFFEMVRADMTNPPTK